MSHFISNQTDLDHVFKLAFDAERLRQNERFNAKNDDHLQSKNQNRGLINAIINHNNKIKDIENKFNLIVNNYEHDKRIDELFRRLYGLIDTTTHTPIRIRKQSI
jgi:hypothetical protein